MNKGQLFPELLPAAPRLLPMRQYGDRHPGGDVEPDRHEAEALPRAASVIVPNMLMPNTIPDQR